MPNWTSNTLTIIVPLDRKADLLKAIEGPDDWIFPLEAFHDFERPKVTVSTTTDSESRQVALNWLG